LKFIFATDENQMRMDKENPWAGGKGDITDIQSVMSPFCILKVGLGD
jgi:hypothetical protein